MSHPAPFDRMFDRPPIDPRGTGASGPVLSVPPGTLRPWTSFPPRSS
jgi:hypothetical protein